MLRKRREERRLLGRFTEPESGGLADVRNIWFVMEARGEELNQINKSFENGLLKTTSDSVW
jgi:hypothetical protein